MSPTAVTSSGPHVSIQDCSNALTPGSPRPLAFQSSRGLVSPHPDAHPATVVLPTSSNAAAPSAAAPEPRPPALGLCCWPCSEAFPQARHTLHMTSGASGVGSHILLALLTPHTLRSLICTRAGCPASPGLLIMLIYLTIPSASVSGISLRP